MWPHLRRATLFNQGVAYSGFYDAFAALYERIHLRRLTRTKSAQLKHSSVAMILRTLLVYYIVSTGSPAGSSATEISLRRTQAENIAQPDTITRYKL